MTTSYISCACNRGPHTADWGENELICYAACNAIAIYDPYVGEIGKVLRTLYQHKGRVNTVRWIKPKSRSAETELLSGSTDGTAIVWSKDINSFRPTATINVQDIVTVVNALTLMNDGSSDTKSIDRLLLCTGSINGEVKLWLRNKEHKVEPFQTLTFSGQLPMECCLFYLPNYKAVVLAVALDDSSIQLLSLDLSILEERGFVQMQSLLGHEDWVRCIDFCYDQGENVLLVSGSQDTTIRLWRISVNTDESEEGKLQQKKQLFMVNNINYSITLESVLSGHDGWVFGVKWHPVIYTNGDYQPMQILSCSLDKSMILWEPEHSTGIWLEKIRVGEVGGNSLGFYGCKFGPRGTRILAHSYQGSFHIWEYSYFKSKCTPSSALSGHFAEVVDLCWDPKGRFLISASADQTTRVHAAGVLVKDWHEIGRPQVHGYDMACLSMLSPYMFASGAEEKVVRIFVAPETFRNQLSRLAVDTDDFENIVSVSASVPALGLTNKAVFESKCKIEEKFEYYLTHKAYVCPTEEELVQHTLWPEAQKLYGHGYEIFSMAARNDGSMLATACKSTSMEHSAIILWNTKTWSLVEKLISHQLTVTQMAFSPNDKFLISVSRDRRWSLFEHRDDRYVLIATSTKKDSLHTRIIWCCAWTFDSVFFVTGSRDGKIAVWSTDADYSKNIHPVTYLHEKDQSITALSFASLKIKDSYYILAVGYETGCISVQIFMTNKEHSVWRTLITYDTGLAHHLTVKKLMFRPQRACPPNTLQLASCGSDHAVKIYDINITELSNVKV